MRYLILDGGRTLKGLPFKENGRILTGKIFREVTDNSYVMIKGLTCESNTDQV